MNVGVVGLQEPRISVTLYKSETYLLSATQTPTQGRMFETIPRYIAVQLCYDYVNNKNKEASAQLLKS